MITLPVTASGMFPLVRVICTLSDQLASVKVIEELRKLLFDEKTKETYAYECRVLDGAEEISQLIGGGVAPEAVLYLFDSASSVKRLKHLSSVRSDDRGYFPAWASGARWAVAIAPDVKVRNSPSVAYQIRASFFRHFQTRLAVGQYPWGATHSKEAPPVRLIVDLPEVEGITRALNSGPDFARAIANEAMRQELPTGSRVSWVRIATKPATCSLAQMDRVVLALDQFQCASQMVITTHPDSLRRELLAGVDLSDERLIRCYLKPPAGRFSVWRPDLHITESGVALSENDEMPGGLPDLFHLDRSYGINQERWVKALSFLCANGPLLFLVSSKWSECYVEEFRWLTQVMLEANYPVFMATTNELGDLEVSAEGVAYKGTKIATIWRQFPIFEVEQHQKLTEIVLLAQKGLIRLIPEFAHFGNKTWFSIYHAMRDEFAKHLAADVLETLDSLLPQSCLVSGPQSFPCTVGGVHIRNVEHLAILEPVHRDGLVLKVTGANTKSARSYGVLMGHGLDAETWGGWVRERLTLGQPFIIQSRFQVKVGMVPVFHSTKKRPELFPCHMLFRPWVFNEEVTSGSICAVPTSTLRVHGMVDMSMVAVTFVDDRR